MGRWSGFKKGLLLAVAVVLAGTAVAAAADVLPRIDLPNSKPVITYGQASPFVVRAVGGSFDGTVTVLQSIESSSAGFSAIASTMTAGNAWGVNPGKLNQNTWFYASYEASGSVEATTSEVVMVGVMAKLGPVGYGAPKKKGVETLRVTGSLEVTPAAAETAHVALQALIGKSTTTVVKGKKVKGWQYDWEDVAGASKDASLTPSAGKDAYTFVADFGTKAAFKGLTMRAVVSYEDAVHEKATAYGSKLTIKK